MPHERNKPRTGAHCLIEMLVQAGIEVCFANPGTSEMQFVAALDDEPRLRPILNLFEGVVTGAADGYARMSLRPAATLLHLGPGLANGLANMHNAQKAGSPMINIIGDHTTFHKVYDAPLNSDIEATAAPYSHWVRTTPSVDALPKDAAEAIAAAMSCNGQIASLVLPADVAWTACDHAGAEIRRVPPGQPDAKAISKAAQWLSNGKRTGIILGGHGLHGDGLLHAGRIAKATGATLFSPYASARVTRGAGLPELNQIPFSIDLAIETLRDFEQVLLIGTREPVAFFAYPGKPSKIIAESTALLSVASPSQDVTLALSALCDELQAGPERNDMAPAEIPSPADNAPITPDTLAQVVSGALIEDTILVDEGVTSSRGIYRCSKEAARHDLLVNVGGSIGDGLPLALGAAVACPDRPVLCISGDGSAAYTLQALWSMAQQNLNVTVVICANRDYSILKGEMVRVGAMQSNDPPHPLLELRGPHMDWVHLGQGFGVPSYQCTTAGDLRAALDRELVGDGPVLIEAVMG